MSWDVTTPPRGSPVSASTLYIHTCSSRAEGWGEKCNISFISGAHLITSGYYVNDVERG